MHLKTGLFAVVLLLMAFFVVLQTGMLNGPAAWQLWGMPASMLVVLLGFVSFVLACWAAGYLTAGDDENAR